MFIMMIMKLYQLSHHAQECMVFCSVNEFRLGLQWPLQSPPAESLLWSPADVAEEAVTPGRGGGEAGGEEGGVPPSLQGDQPHPTAVRTEALQVGGGHHHQY